MFSRIYVNTSAYVATINFDTLSKLRQASQKFKIRQSGDFFVTEKEISSASGKKLHIIGQVQLGP